MMRSWRSSSTRRSPNANAAIPRASTTRPASASSGISPASTSAYEPPEAPDLHLPTLEMTVDDEVDRIIEALQRRGVFD